MPPSSLSTGAVVLLGVVALGSLVQAVFLLVLGRELTAIGRRLDAFQRRMAHDLHPLVADVKRATQSLSAASELTEQQARRIDRLVTTAVAKLVELERVLEDVLVPPANRIVSWVAALRSLRVLVDFYRSLRG